MIRFPLALTVSAAFAFAVITGACANGADPKPSATVAALETRAPAARPSPSPSASASVPPTSTVAATATAIPMTPAAPTVAPSPTPAQQATAPTPTAVQQAAAPTPTPVPPTAPRASAVSLAVRANNLAFDKTSLRVPAGAAVTATLQNDEAGIDHNLAFSLPGLAHGETCKGPCTRTQTFTASRPGSYYFLCTLHDMAGTFVVEP